MAKKKSKTGVTIVAVILGTFIVIGIVLSKSEAPSPQPVQPRDACKDRSFEYLLALKEGKSIAAAYWKPGITPKTLFDVREFNDITHGSYSLVSGRPYKIPRVYYQYEVESSTQGGIPIRKRWNIVLEPSTKNFGGFPCAIVELESE